MTIRQHSLTEQPTPWRETAGSPISPVDFPLMHTLLHHPGLDIKELRFTRFKWKSAFFLLLWPCVWLTCRLTLDRPARQSELCRTGERALNRWLTHPALLCSEQ